MRISLKPILIAGLLLAPVGCQPEPAVEEPTREEEVDVAVEETAETPETAENSDAGTSVQVGGGEGVNVDVNPDQPGTNVNVGSDEN